MKSSNRHLPVGSGATLEDICKLWATLTGEYIPGLKIELTPHWKQGDEQYIEAELCDYAWSLGDVEVQRSIWARKVFFSPLYLISHAQLFDLLITGFRVIDELFTTGNDRRPNH